eukprot:1394794-Amorphochlora_amoeboformis.AAC.1
MGPRVPETKLNRTIQGLEQMLERFTVTREMYVELAVIISREYKTKDLQIQAVQQKLSQWKDDGSLKLRAPYRRPERTETPTQSQGEAMTGPSKPSRNNRDS